MIYGRVPRRRKRPCLAARGGAAFLFLLAVAAAAGGNGWAQGPIPAPGETPASAAWIGEVDYTVEKAATWDAAAAALEEKYREPNIPLKWQTGGFDENRDGNLLAGPLSIAGRSWRDCPAAVIDGQYLHTERAAVGRGSGAFYLRAMAAFDEPTELKAFFSADFFAAVYVNGREACRRFFDCPTRADGESVDVSFPAGESEVIFVVGRRPNCGTAYFRIGRTNNFRRRIGILRALERLFPNEVKRALAAQAEIAAAFEGFGDGEQARAEYRRLYLMAERDAGARARSLDELARLYAAAGKSDWAVEALEARLALPADARDDAQAAARRKAAIEYARLAAASGNLPAAVAALQGELDVGESAEVRRALAEALSSYSLGEAALASHADARGSAATSGGQADGADKGGQTTPASGDPKAQAGDSKPRGDRGIEPPRSNPTFIELNHTAASKIESAKELAAAGAPERAAEALVDALDAEGPAAIPSQDGAIGTEAAVRAVLAKDKALADEYRKCAQARPLPAGGAGSALARRPLCEAEREALWRLAVEAAARGEYSLAALAAGRMVENFPPTAEALALGVSSLAHAGRLNEAREVAEKADCALLETKLSSGQTLGAYMEATFGANRKGEAYALEPIAISNALELVWRAPLRVAGAGAAAGGAVGGPAAHWPRAAGMVLDGRIYVYDGARVSARDVESGGVLFDEPTFLPPGLRLPEEAEVNRAGQVLACPAAIAAGGGAVYYTSVVQDDAAKRALSILAAADATTGRTLWAVLSTSVGEGMNFSSAPAWAHDRVYALMRRSGQMPSVYLSCFDARDGAPVNLTFIDSCWLPMGAPYGWGTPALDPAVLAPAPAVAGDKVFAVSNSGAVAVVDALSCAIESIHTYPRAVISPSGEGLVRMLEGRAYGAISASEGVAAVAPSDTAEAFLVRPGQPAARFDIPGARAVLGISGDTAIAILDTVTGIDTGTGRVAWRAEGPQEFMPGGTVSGGVVYAGTPDGLVAISAADGKTLARCAWPDGAARGNVIVSNEMIAAFGESDVAAFRFAKKPQSAGVSRAGESGPRVEPRAGGARGAAGGLLGLWAAPAFDDAYILASRCAAAPVDYASGERRFVFLPGATLSLWEVTGAPSNVWNESAPFTPGGAFYADGRLIVYSGREAAAVDAKDGRILWRHEAGAPLGGLASAAHIDACAAPGGRVAYVRANRLVMLDAETGEVTASRALAEQVVSTAAGAGVYAVVTAPAGGGDMLWAYDCASGAIRWAVQVGGPQGDLGARAAVSGDGRVFVACPNASLAVCVDAATGKILWKYNDSGRGDRIAQTGVEGGSFYYVVAQGNVMRAIILDQATGKTAGVYPSVSPAGVFGDETYVLVADSRIRKYVRGRKDPAWSAPAALTKSSQRALDWRLAEGRLYVLLADGDAGGPKGLSVAAYDAATGDKKGEWALPLTNAAKRGAVFSGDGRGAVLVAGAEGVLRATLEGLARDRTVSAYALGEPATTATIGEVTPAKATAARISNAVADGDACEWPAESWVVAKGAGGASARVALAANANGLVIAVRTGGAEGAGRIEDDCIRMSVDSKNASARQGPAVDFDAVIASGRMHVLFSRGKGEAALCRRENATGGYDYEAAIPWSALGRQGSESGRSPAVGVMIAGREAGGGYWSWPEGCAYEPEYFGTIATGGKGD